MDENSENRPLLQAPTQSGNLSVFVIKCTHSNEISFSGNQPSHSSACDSTGRYTNKRSIEKCASMSSLWLHDRYH